MVGHYCAVALCNNSRGKCKEKGITFHRFPKDPALCKEWVNKCKRLDVFNPDHGHICSEHFQKSDFERDLKSELLGTAPRIFIKRGAVPSLKIPNDAETPRTVCGTERREKMEKRHIEMSLINVCCAVYDCQKDAQNKGTKIHYYNFPKNPVILKKWINSSIWKQGFNIETAKICSRHFTRDSFGTKYKFVNSEIQNLCTYVELLKEDAVPTLHLCQVDQKISILNTEVSLPEDDKSFLVPTLFQTQDSSETNNTESSSSNLNRTLINEKYEMLQLEIRNLNASILSGRKKIESLKGKITDVEQNLNRVENIYKQKHLKYQELKASRGDESEEMETAEDDEILRKVFSESQRHIITGKRKIHWSADDLAVAYTLRHMGNKRCYNYITKNLKIPLPALSSIKRWAYLECKT